MKQKILTTIILLMISCVNVIAQEVEHNTVVKTEEKPTRVMSTRQSGNLPTSREFGANGEATSIQSITNKSTGVGAVSIPLHQVNYKGMGVPISLNYNLGGIQVASIASEVGAGWNMSGHFKITRQMRDEDDLTWGLNDKDYVNGIKDRGNSRDVFNKIHQDGFDSEPDIFNFSIPNYSGIFVIMSSSSEIKTIPHMGLKIEVSGYNSFTITDPSGVEYYFSSVNTESNGDNTYYSAWNLESMKNIYNEYILFEYTNNTNEVYKSYNEILYVKPDGAREVKNNTKNITRNTHYLKRIHWRTGKIEYLYSSDRKDFKWAKKLDRIEIYDRAITDNYKSYSVDETYILNRKFNFNISYFSSYRPKLNSVTEVAGTATRTIARFDYNLSVNLPSYSSKDFDTWGYYNGKGNNTYYDDTQFSDNDYKRKPSFNYTKANVLTKYTNEMGGNFQYEFEPNSAEYKNKNYPIGGLRVKSVSTFNSKNILSDKVRYEYSEASAFEAVPYLKDRITDDYGGMHQYYYTYSIESMSDYNGGSVSYGKVKEIYADNSYKLYEYSTYNDIESETFPATYYYLPSKSPTQNYTKHSGFPSISKFWKVGLLLSEADYTPQNQNIKKISYQYIKNPEVAGEVYGAVSSLGYNKYAGEIPKIVVYKWTSEPVLLESYNTYSTTEPSVYVTNEYNEEKLLLTSQKTSVNGDIYHTYTKYSGDYNVIDRDYNVGDDSYYNGLRALRVFGVNSAKIEVTTKKNDVFISGELYKYELGERGTMQRPVICEKYVLLPNVDSLTPSYTSSSYNFIYDSNKYELQETYDHYSKYGEMLTATAVNGLSKSIILGYHDTMPIAEVTNASSSEHNISKNEVYHTSFEDFNGTPNPLAKTGQMVAQGGYEINLSNIKPGSYILSYWNSTDNGANWKYNYSDLDITASNRTQIIGVSSSIIDEIRIHPKDAIMRTTTYNLGVGKTSETDVNGVTTYYEYDEFGRLIRILNNDRNKTKEYEYVYGK